VATSPVVVTDDVAARLSVMRASLARVTRPVTTAVPVIVVAVVTLTLLVHTRVLATRPPVKATVPPVEKIPPVESVVAMDVPAATIRVLATETLLVTAVGPAPKKTFAGAATPTWAVLA